VRRFEFSTESWPLQDTFRISRGAKTSSEVVVVSISEGGHTGWGECVPYGRYGESLSSVEEQLQLMRPEIVRGIGTEDLQALLPAGAARNALDCALWDLQARGRGQKVWQLLNLPAPQTVTTAYTLGVDSPAAMGARAEKEKHRPLLKLKMSGVDDLARVQAVREGSPDARIIVDANEGWQIDQFEPLSLALAGLGVELIEQPLPAADDYKLADQPHPVPICADESCHTSADLPRLQQYYEFINIKLDKAGGLTEAVKLHAAARQLNMGVMVGCMVSTSLAMAPAMLIAQDAEFVDLDGPLLLQADRSPGLKYEGSLVYPPDADFWG
jgi:L-alanine-DL-glutamate epimerase-like enolase superfamily enzyme